MKAVVLPTGNPDLLDPLTGWMPEFLLPVANKPVVEHLIELLIRHNIKDIILVCKHMPYETEQFFGNGRRWGCNISYSLEREYEGIGPTLGRIRSRLDDSFLCLPWNVMTNIDISTFVKAHDEGSGDITVPEQEKVGYAKEIKGSYPFIMTPKALSSCLTLPKTQDLGQIITLLSDQGLGLNTYSSSFNFRTIHNLKEYLETNKHVLKGELSGVIIPGKQVEPGIWIGRRTRIHPDTKISPPSLIGSHCNVRKGTIIKGETIIGDNVIVDRGVFIERSVIFGNTYIGSYTEIKDSVIRKNLMIDVPRLLNLYIGDDFILGDLDKKVIAGKVEHLFNLMLAVFLLILFSPIITFFYLHHLVFPSKRSFSSDERYGDYEVIDLQGNMKPKAFNLYTFRSRNRFIAKLPGLFNVIKGNINLVGNSPLTHEEVNSLQAEWETLRFKAHTGLFHLWETEGGSDLTWEEKIVTENYYAATRSFWGDLKILVKNLLGTGKV